MDFEFSADQEMLRASVRRLLSDRAPLAYVREQYQAPAVGADAVWSGLVDLGVFGLGMVDTAVVLEELGRALCPAPFLSSAIGAYALADGALRTSLAAGRIGTVAIFDEGARYEWRSPATTATFDGVTWRLSGTKSHVPDGAAADVMLVTAMTAEPQLGVFEVVATDAVVAATPTVDGSRKEARVELDGVRARRLFPDDGDATDLVAATIDRLAVGYVVDAVGAAQRALELAVEYAKSREQFGQPIGSFQAVQHLCADMLRAVELGRAAGYYACWAADNADVDHGEAHRAATIAKAFAGEAFAQLGGTAIQVFGGIGFTWEHDIHMYYKRLLTASVALGNTDVHLAELANLVLP